MNIKKYKVITASLRVREKPSSHTDVAILGTLPRNAEFYSDKQIRHLNNELWAQKVDVQGKPSGWLQVSTLFSRYCQELPLPVHPAFLPEPTLETNWAEHNQKIDEAITLLQSLKR